MKDDGKKYVVYGMKAKCSEGSMENYISTDVGHGVLYQGQPLFLNIFCKNFRLIMNIGNSHKKSHAYYHDAS